MSCGVNSVSKVFISVHQCMRNTLNVNKSIFLCRGFNTLKKVLSPVSLVKLSHQPINDRTSRFEQNGLNVLFKENRLVVPLACNLFSDKCYRSLDEQKKDDKSPEVKISLYQRLKKMYKEYWYVLVPVHLITSCIWFGGFYYLAASGIDIPTLLENLGAPNSWIENLKTSKVGNVVLAYSLYKVATPIRYTVTIGGTTISINYLKQMGWIKPVPNKQQIKKFYQEGKDVFKASYKDKMQVTKNEFFKTKHEMKKQLEEAKSEFHKTLTDTREGFKEGVKSGAEEWKVISNALNKDIKKIFNKKTDN